ncbi:MAG: glycosyltransferase [Chloroflexi bacterium]|nr:glycosyltransferase [Chloroflexota bacterium]
MKPFLSVIVPAYNESTNIQHGALSKVADYLEQQSYAYEVIVVDDGSDDNTAILAEEFAASHRGFRVLRNPHRGKAFTVATGMQQAEGDIVLFTDMDQATPIDESAKLLPYFAQGYHIVIGSRGTVRRNAPIWRRIMSGSQVLLRNLILGFRDITDTQCGFKAFKHEVVAPILNSLSVYSQRDVRSVLGASVSAGFDVEMLFVAHRLGFHVKEVPVQWDYRFSRRVNLLRDSMRGIRELVSIRMADARGAYSNRKNI